MMGLREESGSYLMNCGGEPSEKELGVNTFHAYPSFLEEFSCSIEIRYA